MQGPRKKTRKESVIAVTRWLENTKEKQRITRDILEALPEWFGIPEANDDYVEAVKDCAMIVKVIDGEAVGFFAVKATGEKTLSLHVLGIKKEHQRKGIGKELFSAVLDYAKEKGYRFLTVKTLDPSREHKEYDETRKFYESLGFVKLETFPTLWGAENPCLLMVRHVDDGKTP